MCVCVYVEKERDRQTESKRNRETDRDRDTEGNGDREMQSFILRNELTRLLGLASPKFAEQAGSLEIPRV